MDKAADILNFKPAVKGMSNTSKTVFALGGDLTLQNQFGFEALINFQIGIEKALTYYASI